MSRNSATRLVVVSNRLPLSIEQGREGWRIRPSSGGLVTALAPGLRDRGGMWIGWPGCELTSEAERLLSGFSREAGYELHPVHLTEEEHRGYYYGFANEIIWPLFHDLQTRCNFAPGYWSHYLSANRSFAKVALARCREGDYVWVHDYHLMHLAGLLRQGGMRNRMGFFLHIPFPPPDIYLKLPWRLEVMEALLEYDLIGFQTVRDRRNFCDCLRTLLPAVRVQGRGRVLNALVGNREVRIGSFPISIDAGQFSRLAASPGVGARAAELREAMGVEHIILGVDRLDYTKGIPQRIEAVRRLILGFPELAGRVTLVQIVVPSRVEVPEYQSLKTEIEQLVSEVNGRLSRPGWSPVHYLFRSLSREELVAWYRAADMALITPLKDGMNLVAKEYCACQVDDDGVLFLSEFAGAAAQLQRRGAVLVNPNHVERVAQAVRAAMDMDHQERCRRMRRLRDSIRRNDIFAWLDSFLEAAFSRHLDDFAPLDSVDFSRGFAESEAVPV